MENNSKDFLNSYECKSIVLELGISTFLFAVVSAISSFVENQSKFQWTEVLSIGISAFLIIFFGIHSNKKIFTQAQSNLSSIPLFFKVILASLIPIACVVPIFVPFLNEFLLTHSFDDLLIQSFWNFFRYFAYSLLVAMELFLCGLLFYEDIKRYILGEKHV